MVIPAELRRELDFQPGDELVAWTEGGRLVLERREAVLAELHGMFSTSEPGAVERLLAWRRGEAARDEAELRGEEAR